MLTAISHADPAHAYSEDLQSVLGALLHVASDDGPLTPAIHRTLPARAAV